ncbi:DUF4974 domain-containing protein [Fulvivirgaceae bacterium BMA12]|uniref:DUF4974 domain-containing protein n=1 Tax=Agaribacillus aureus TaxID=3051825 RepID=A0ABT8LD36_9BACT|nr:DUF4974 domain-containing protein [Fulvivirgaceae bacterium BMA12]
MKYLDYTVEDFVLDGDFRQWVINPSKERNLFWQKWIEAHPEKQEIVKQAVEIILQLPIKQYEITEEEIKNISLRLERSIDLHENPSAGWKTKTIPLNNPVISAKSDRRFYSRKVKRGVSVAAAVLLIFGLGYYFPLLQKFVFPENAPSKAKLTVKENPRGRKSTLFLSDGSKIILNSYSKISFRHPFEEGKREVYLEGEAFFEIEKDENRPFRVFTQNMATTVLGTSFNVRAYPEDLDIRVSLATGQVRIDNLNKDIDTQILSPGEELIYVKSKDTFQKSKFDLQEVLSWKDQILFFRNADEATVINRLEHWYDVEIEVLNKSPKPWAINASFDNRALESVLRTLSYSMDFDFTIDGKEVTITY